MPREKFACIGELKHVARFSQTNKKKKQKTIKKEKKTNKQDGKTVVGSMSTVNW